MGVLKICIAAGVRNCAVLLRPASLLRIRENCFLTGAGRLASWGAINGGRLNDAKTVRLSRSAKSAYDTFGILEAAGDVAEAPKTLAK